VVVAVIWTFSSVLVQYIFDNLDFRSPFFLTYVCTSLFSVQLPLFFGLEALGITETIAWSRTGENRRLLTDAAAAEAAGGLDGRSQKLTHMETLAAAAMVCPLWFLANFSYNWSLGKTSVTSSTVISSSSAAFTLLLSVVLLGEPLTLLKLAGVLLCWTGNALTAVGDGNGGGGGGDEGPPPPAAPPSVAVADPVLGDALCLFSAVMYAVYTTAIRHYAPQDMALFFGLLGGFNCVLLSPVVLALHLSSVESLATLTLPVLGLIVLKGLVDNVLSDYLWALAVLLTSPSVATVGLSLTIPMAIASQLLLPPSWLVAAAPLTAIDFLACACVVAGFVVINYASQARSTAADAPACHRALRVPLLRPRAAAAAEPLSEPSDTGQRPAQRLSDGQEGV